MLLARFLFQEASLFWFKNSVFFDPPRQIFRSTPSLLSCFFDPPRPSLAKEGSTAFPKPLSPQGTGDVTALRCSEPLRSKVGGASKPSPYFAGWDRLGTACFFPSPCFAGWDRLGIAGEGKKTVLICEICGTFKGKRICGTIMSERNEIRRNNF